MSEPDPVVENDKCAAEEEEWVAELDDGEMSEVAGVDDVTGNSEEGEGKWEAVDSPQQELDADDSVDESGEEAGGEDCVLFDELGEVV